MVGLGGLPIAHGDVEDFEGSPGADGVQWIGRKGVRGRCIVLIFYPEHYSRFPHYPNLSESGTGIGRVAQSVIRDLFHSANLYFYSVHLGSSWSKMPLLTVGLLGAQIVWSTEMGYGEFLSTP